jgi:hypothetical protein
MTWTSRAVGVLCLGLLVVVVAIVVTAGQPGDLVDNLARFVRSAR